MERPQIKIAPTGFDIAAMGVVVVAVLYAGISLALNYSELPDQVPTHFNANGEPDSYGSPSSMWMLFGVQLATAVGVWVLARYPHKHNYMVEITEENAPRLYATSVSLLHAVNAICTGFFGYMIVTNLSVAQGQLSGMGAASMWIFLGSLTAVIIYFIWKSFKIS